MYSFYDNGVHRLADHNTWINNYGSLVSYKDSSYLIIIDADNVLFSATTSPTPMVPYI